MSALTNVCSCVVLLPLPAVHLYARSQLSDAPPARVVFLVRGHQAPRRCVRSDGLLHHLFHLFVKIDVGLDLGRQHKRGKIRLDLSRPGEPHDPPPFSDPSTGLSSTAYIFSS